MLKSRALSALLILGMVMGLSTLGVAWAATVGGPLAGSGASLTVRTNGASAV